MTINSLSKSENQDFVSFFLSMTTACVWLNSHSYSVSADGPEIVLVLFSLSVCYDCNAQAWELFEKFENFMSGSLETVIQISSSVCYQNDEKHRCLINSHQLSRDHRLKRSNFSLNPVRIFELLKRRVEKRKKLFPQIFCIFLQRIRMILRRKGETLKDEKLREDWCLLFEIMKYPLFVFIEWLINRKDKIVSCRISKYRMNL